jgi:hypothetical protein
MKRLSQPTVLPSGKRLPGLRFDHPRQLAVCRRWSGLRTLLRAAASAWQNFTSRWRRLWAVHRRLPAGVAPLRRLQTARQGAGRQASAFSAVSAAPSGLPPLRAPSEALRTPLRTSHRRARAARPYRAAGSMGNCLTLTACITGFLRHSIVSAARSDSRQHNEDKKRVQNSRYAPHNGLL